MVQYMLSGVSALNALMELWEVCNGRSVEVQLVRKLLTERFVWDVSFPADFQFFK